MLRNHAVDLPSQALGTVQYPTFTNARLQVDSTAKGVDVGFVPTHRFLSSPSTM